MLETFQATLSSMLILFLCISIGFVLNKTKVLPDNSATVLSKLENYLLIPALSLNTFMKYCTLDSLKENYSIILYGTGITLVMMTIATFLSKLFSKDDYTRNVYKYALTFANFAYLGNAIVPIIIGEEALYYYLLFTLPMNAVSQTWGITILTPSGTAKKSFFRKLLNAPCISIVLGIVLGLTGVYKYLPGFISTSLGSLAACMGPMAMLLTGFVIGKYNFKELLKNKKAYIASLLRLFVFPVLIVLVLVLLKADKMIIQFSIFSFGTSLGINTVVFPTAFGVEAKTGASMAMVSNAIGVLTIPLLYTAVMMFI